MDAAMTALPLAAAHEAGRVANSSPEALRRKVLHVTWRLSESGGIAIVIRNIIKHHDTESTDLHIAVARNGPRDALEAVADRCTIHQLSTSFGRGSGTLARLGLIWAIARLIRREDPAVVHSHSGTAWWTSLARMVSPGRTWLLEVHDAPGNGRHGVRTERFEGWLCRRAGYIAVCHSTSVVDEVCRKWRLPVGQTRMFPLGIDTAMFADAADDRSTRRALGASDDSFVAIGVGRLVPSKQFDVWIEVAAQLKARTARPCRFIIVGDGPKRAALEELASARGLRQDVVFAGSLSQLELVGPMRAADAYLSTSAYEGFGLAVVEAMAAGLPAVVSDVGGHRDLIDRGVTGWLCAARCEFVEHLLCLAADGDLGREMGTASHSRSVARFDVASFARAVDVLYADARTGPGGRYWALLARSAETETVRSA